MRKILIITAASALVAAVPAWASKPAHPAHPSHPSKPDKPKSCAPRDVGYYANGTLVSATLTPAAKKDHYNGTLTVDVKRANHHAPTGSESFTLMNARVRFGKGVSATSTAPGDRTVLHGTITELPRGCSSTGFTPTITVKNVRISTPAKH